MDEANNCNILALPYEGTGCPLGMMIVLPNEDDGLSELESRLSPELFKSWNGTFQERWVNVYLPKFKLDSQTELKGALQKMGMTDAFDENRANLEGISGDGGLHVSDVVHKAFIAVNEEGTEAAAAVAFKIYWYDFDHPRGTSHFSRQSSVLIYHIPS